MTAKPTPPDGQAVLLAAHQQMMAHFAQTDAAGVAAIYTTDAQLLPVYSATISGRAAIQAFWQGCIDMGITAIQRNATEIEQLGTTANEVGRYTLLGHTGKVLDIGKYVIIWKEQAGDWKIHRDIWTSDLPPAK